MEQTQAWPISIFKHAGHSDQISDGHTPVSLHWELIVGFLTKLLGGEKKQLLVKFFELIGYKPAAAEKHQEKNTLDKEANTEKSITDGRREVSF